MISSNAVNKELSIQLQDILFHCEGYINILSVVEDFFNNLPPIYFEKDIPEKEKCWRCHGKGTSDSMA